jgi:hypothetical protein
VKSIHSDKQVQYGVDHFDEFFGHPGLTPSPLPHNGFYLDQSRQTKTEARIDESL